MHYIYLREKYSRKYWQESQNAFFFCCCSMDTFSSSLLKKESCNRLKQTGTEGRHNLKTELKNLMSTSLRMRQKTYMLRQFLKAISLHKMCSKTDILVLLKEQASLMVSRYNNTQLLHLHGLEIPWSSLFYLLLSFYPTRHSTHIRIIL